MKIVTKQKKPSPWLIFGKWKDLKTSSNRNTFDDSSFILGIEGGIFPCWRIDQRKSHFYTKRADIIFTCCRDSVLTMEQPFNCTWFVEGDFLVWQTMGGRACDRILITSTSCTVFIKITHKIWTCHIFNRVKRTCLTWIQLCEVYLHVKHFIPWAMSDKIPHSFKGGFTAIVSLWVKTNSTFSSSSWSSGSAFSQIERYEIQYEKSLS